MDAILFLYASYAIFILFSEGMADYQHVLAVHADTTRRKKRNWADVEPQLGQQLLDLSFYIELELLFFVSLSSLHSLQKKVV